MRKIKFISILLVLSMLLTVPVFAFSTGFTDVSEKATYAEAVSYPMQYGRCLIPASWYFEWEPAAPKKIKHAIQAAGPITYLAGLSRVEKDGEATFVVLTRQACSQIRYIYDRMPVILQPQFHDEWLHSKNTAGLFAHADTDVIVKE